MSDATHRRFTEKVLDIVPRRFVNNIPIDTLRTRARVIRRELAELDELLQETEECGYFMAEDLVNALKECCDVSISIHALFHGFGVDMEPFEEIVIENNLERLAVAGMDERKEHYQHSPEEKARLRRKCEGEIIAELLRRTES